MELPTGHIDAPTTQIPSIHLRLLAAYLVEDLVARCKPLACSEVVLKRIVLESPLTIQQTELVAQPEWDLAAVGIHLVQPLLVLQRGDQSFQGLIPSQGTIQCPSNES
jgi:hypothetical protein